MPQTKRISVRPIEQRTIADKKFKKVVEVKKKVRIDPIHHTVVCHDLRNGSLVSLARHLEANHGISDERIAHELRLLICGSRDEAQFRLLVIDHPDAPKQRGGRPSARHRAPTEQELKIASAFRKAALPGAVEAAVCEVAADFGIAESTVYKIARRVAAFEARESRRRDISNRTKDASVRAQAVLDILRTRREISLYKKPRRFCDRLFFSQKSKY